MAEAATRLKEVESDVKEVVKEVDPFAPPSPPDKPIFDHRHIEVKTEPFRDLHLPVWGPWLLYKLAKKWPRLNERTYISWLRNYMGVNTAFFRKSRRAIVLARVENDALDPQPVVKVVFFFKHKECAPTEIGDLLRELTIWAKSIRASRIDDLMSFTDVEPVSLMTVLGKIGLRGQNRNEIWFDVPKEFPPK